MSKKDGRMLEFPPLIDSSRQAWVERLGPSDRSAYEADRAGAIQVDIPIVAERMRNFPGFEEVPEEAIMNMAHRVAVMIHDAYDEGRHVASIVIDNEERQQHISQQLASYHINRMGGHG